MLSCIPNAAERLSYNGYYWTLPMSRSGFDSRQAQNVEDYLAFGKDFGAETTKIDTLFRSSKLLLVVVSLYSSVVEHQLCKL